MTEQNVRIMCPNLSCRRILAVPNTARGKTVRCRNCATNIRVPATPSSQPPEEPEAAKAEPAPTKP